MTPGHASQLELDTLALDALDPGRATRVRAHLAGCAECREDERISAELRTRFVRDVLPRGLPRRVPARRWWLVPALAAALVLIVVAVRPRPAGRVPDDDLGIKGDATWQVFANRDGRVFAVHDGTELLPGDQIRFAVTAAGAHYLLVASIDASGAATIYYPYEGTQSMAITGERIEPTGSIVLDAARGPERIYAILSDDPIAAEVVRAQLRAVGRGGPEVIRNTRVLALPARAQVSLVFEKAVP